MADQGRWFKLWVSAPSDDALLRLTPAMRWAWAVLGCYMKLHGTNGQVEISSTNGPLAAEMGVPQEALFDTITALPHVSLTMHENRHGDFPVTGTVVWSNWVKYQEDSTQAKRSKRYRASRSKKRREEMLILPETLLPESRKTPPEESPSESSSPRPVTGPVTGLNGFEGFWTAYPRKAHKGEARRAWAHLRPSSDLQARMLAAVAAQRTWPDWQKDGGKFIPYPASWLRAEGWLDRPPEVQRGPGSILSPEGQATWRAIQASARRPL